MGGPLFLGIETSCDETSVAVLRGQDVVYESVYSQVAEHQDFGGVVPSLAAGAHLRVLPVLVKKMQDQVPLRDIDGIAVTCGPGLVGGLLVGIMMAKGLAISLQKPLWGIHHLEGHALMPRMMEDIPFPYLLLLLSGGHCLLTVVKGVGQYHILGHTRDDAMGECLDKIARELGEGYPGGPAIENLARSGAPMKDALPIPLRGDKTCDFSFSGLKTAAIQWIRRREMSSSACALSSQWKADFCATVQEVMMKSVASRLENALTSVAREYPQCGSVVMSGGVASNAYFRKMLQEVVTAHGKKWYAPPPQYCTDNGVMIAWAGYEQWRCGVESSLHVLARPVWSLENLQRR